MPNCGALAQAEAKKHLGAQASAFERIADGLRTVERSDLVRLALRPVIVGRVEFFSVNEVTPLPS